MADDLRRWAASLRGEPADVLASLAGALGLPWDGPGTASIAMGSLPASPPWELLDVAREATLAAGDRRRLGAHHTPPDLARRLAAIAVMDYVPNALVLDPACGGGAFLVAAARLRPEIEVVGIDLDPLAVATTRAALHSAGVEDADVRVGDGLEVDGDELFDIVIGNPPFLSPLATETSGTPAAQAMRSALRAPYLDVAGLFLLKAAEVANRVVLLQPESILVSRDAGVLREHLDDRLEGLWVAGEPIFGASVRVCAPMLGLGNIGTVRRWQGAAVTEIARSKDEDRERLDFDTPPSWAGLRPTTAPRVRIRADVQRLGSLATATAAFRDEFYGVAAAVTDGGEGAPVVTSGLVDPGRVLWGERSARIAGTTYATPTVDVALLEGRVGRWAAARLVPKVLVAAQTKVVEAAPDPDGRYVPLTPVISVAPHDPGDVWLVAAALTSPVVTAWALHSHGGAALTGEAVKLSASQVLEAPLPDDAEAWAQATELLRAGDVEGCGAALAGGDERLLEWWRTRLPRPRTV